MKRLLTYALVCSVAFALAGATIAPARVHKRSVAVTRPAVLHFPLLHTLHRVRPLPAGHIVSPANGDVRPTRFRAHKLPSWFVRRRMAILSVQPT